MDLKESKVINLCTKYTIFINSELSEKYLFILYIIDFIFSHINSISNVNKDYYKLLNRNTNLAPSLMTAMKIIILSNLLLA